MLVFSFVTSPILTIPFPASADSTTPANSVEVGSKAINPASYKEPDAVTGSLNYDLPLSLPPGRNGLTPSLSLSYSSLPSNDTNVFGYGWTLSIPYIERLNEAGAQQMFSRNDFYSSLSGELAPTVSGTTTSFGPLVETGDFLDYKLKGGNYWEVTDKAGTVYKFGYSSSTRQDNASNTAQIAKWMLEEVRDTNGNYIKYEYYKDSNQIYPSRIIYTGNGVTDGPFEVEFTRESRPDTTPSYRTGFRVRSNYRISDITIEIDNSWVRKYELDYTSGDNNTRSLLGTSTESGRDVSGTVVALPGVTFDYTESMKGWVETPSLDLPIYIRDKNLPNDDNGVRFGDVNGDSLTDLMQGFQGGAYNYNRIYLNDGSGWELNASWTLPVNFVEASAENYARLADVNGDLLVDIVQAYRTTATTVNRTFINTGSGWSENPAWDLPLYFKDWPQSQSDDAGVRMADLNGDGLVDVFRSYNTGTTTFNSVYFNNGNGWTLSASTTIPLSFLNAGTDQYVLIEDVNNDGLADFVQGYAPSSYNRTYINTGSGWIEDPAWDVPTYFTTAGGADYGVRFGDFNGDGFVDIVHSYIHSSGGEVHKTYINNGNGWTNDEEWNPHQDVNFEWGGYDEQVRIFDVDGDNSLDIVKAVNPPYGGDATIVTFINNGGEADMLVGITNAQGATTEIDYETSTLSGQDTGQLINPNLPLLFHTVKEITVDDGLGTEMSTTFTYGGGRYYFASSTDRKFAGFATTTKTDSEGNVTKVQYHQGNSTNSAQGEYSDHIAKMGYPYVTETRDESGNLFSRVIEKWDLTSLGNGRNFVKKANSLVQTYDGDADHKDLAEEYTYSSTNGNLTQKVEWGEVTGSADGTWSDTGSDKRTTTISYASSTSSYLVGLASNETVTDQSSFKVAEKRYYYDSQVSGTVVKGNMTKQEMWATSTTYVDVEKDYNAYGLVTVERDLRDKATYFSYDSKNLYVASTTNPVSLQTFYAYDYSNGKVAQMTDSNGRVFSTTFDGLDRVAEEKQPDIASPGTTVTKVTYTYTDTGMPKRVLKTEYLDGSNSVNTYSYFDGLGRVIQVRREAEVSNNYTVQDIEYNERGLLKRQSQLYFESGSAYAPATDVAGLWSNFAYDALGRENRIDTTVGSSTKIYDDWKTTITDANGNLKDLYSDAYKNLIRVTEYNSTSTYDTNYTYDRAGNLTRITDASSNVRNFTHDGLGRRLSAEDLHAAGDTTYGTWIYQYDAAGNLGTSTDPKGQVVTYTYDDLNRVLTENYTAQSGIEIAYGYDSCPEGKGRLCAATTTNGATSYEYNALGQVKKESKKVGTTTYATQFAYDRLGNQTLVTYPDSAEAKYAYNGAGMLESVSRKENGDLLYTDLVTDYDYAPHGLPTYVEYANSVQTIYTYDPAKLYRLTNKTTVSGGGMGGSLEDGLEGLEEAQGLLAAFDFSEGLGVLEDLNLFADEDDSEESELGDSPVGAEPIVVEVPSGESSDESVPVVEEESEVIEGGESGSEAVVISVPEPEGTSTEPTEEEAESGEETTTPAEVIVVTTTPEPVSPTVKPDTLYLEDIDILSYSPKAPGAEELALRSENSKTFRLGTNEKGESKYATRIYQGPIHEKTATGQFVDRAVTLREANNEWLAFSPAQSVTVPKQLSDKLFSFRGKGREISVEVTHATSTAVRMEKQPMRGDVAVYDNALGQGASLEIAITEDYVRKDVVLDSFDAAKPFIDGENRAAFGFVIAGNGMDLRSGDQLLSDVGTIETNQPVMVVDKAGSVVSYIWSPLAVSNEDIVDPEDFIPVTVRYETTNKGIKATKLIPAEALEDAAYPVYADLTFSQYSGYGDGSVVNTTPTATTSQYSSHTWLWHDVIHTAQTSPLSYSRTFLPFDTSSLPDNALVASGTVNIYITTSYTGFGDGGDFSKVFQGFQNSPYAVISEDFDQCGNATYFPDAGSEALHHAVALPTNSYRAFQLNATGTAWISKTGFTKLCIRNAHDFMGAPGAASNLTRSGFKFAAFETAGTSSDPYIELVYTVPNTTSTAPTGMQTEGEENPVTVSDSLPEFSAIFNDSDSGEYASAYRIQVATSTAWWDYPLWDSGKVGLTSGTSTTYLYDEAFPYGWWGGGWSSSVDYYHTATSADGGTSIRNTYQSAWGGLGMLAGEDYPDGLRTDGFTNLKIEVNRGTSTPDLRVTLVGGPSQTDLGEVELVDYVPGSSLSANTWHTATIPLADLGGVDTNITYFIIKNGNTGTVYFDEIRLEGSESMGAVAAGQRSEAIAYKGLQFPQDGSTHYWRIKFWDDENAEGVWSTATSSFTMGDTAGASALQDISYTYDNVGNITRIVEEASTTANRISAYTYDGLYRLTSASTTNAAGLLLYREAFTYDPLGNITSKNDLGNYSYQGSSGSSYANPHAVTLVSTSTGSSTYSYDRNGNLTQYISPITDYGDSFYFFDEGWANDWWQAGWSSDIDMAYSGNTYQGAYAILNNYRSNWGGVGFLTDGTPNGISTSPYSDVKFAVNRGTSTPDIRLELIGPNSVTLGEVEVIDYVPGGSLSSNTWHEVTIPLSDLGATATTVTYFILKNGNTGAVLFDEIRFVEEQVGGDITTHGWTYDNRLASTTEGSSVTLYKYDHTGERTQIGSLTGTTTYANSLYSITAGSSTKHIMANGELLATVEGSGASATVHYAHTDHLGGTNVVTNNIGNLEQTLDYYPFGEIRINVQESVFDEKKKFTGHEYDSGTSLIYMKARYQEPEIGRFTSQDPAHLQIGDRSFGYRFGKPQTAHLLDPQALNSYSYAQNNPVQYTDPTGEIVHIPVVGVVFGIAWVANTLVDAYVAKTVFWDYPDEFTTADKVDAAGDIAIDLFSGGIGLALTRTQSVVFDLLTLPLDFIESEIDERKDKKNRGVIQGNPSANTQSNRGGARVNNVSGSHSSNQSSYRSHSQGTNSSQNSASNRSGGSSSSGHSVSSGGSSSNQQVSLTRQQRENLLRAAGNAYRASGGR